MSMFTCKIENDCLIAFDGTRYPYKNQAERRQASADLKAHEQEFKSMLESKFNYHFSASEMALGRVAHTEDRAAMRAAKAKWGSIFAAKPVEQEQTNPFIRELAEYDREREREADPRRFSIVQAAAEFDKKAKEKARKEAMANDPERQKRIAQARAALTAVKLDPRATDAHVYGAERLVEAAESLDDLSVYTREESTYRGEYKQHLQARAQSVMTEAARAAAECEQLSQSPLE
jgi:hypothetical protein